MASVDSDVRYDKLPLKRWVKMAKSGEIALTDFQRSYVWSFERIQNYISSILSNKPVGLFLILDTSTPAQFEPREFKEMSTPLDDVSELVLDGQQRLTSLLQVLNNRAGLTAKNNVARRFFIIFKDLSSEVLEYKEVINFAENSANGKKLADPKVAYSENTVPIDVLNETIIDGNLTPLQDWCAKIGDELDRTESFGLMNRIKTFFDEHFFDRTLWYCSLPESIDRVTATQIFKETNTSSVRIKEFDIAVADARGKYDQDVRNDIEEKFTAPENSVMRYYFDSDPENWIPEVGEWMLKVACIHVNLTPKESNYSQALNYIFANENASTAEVLKEIFADLCWALDHAAEFGGPTKRTLPSWPPLHVLSALRKHYLRITKPPRKNTARKLIQKYYWRCLFSGHYEGQANDRLKRDFDALKSALESIYDSGTYSNYVPALDEADNPTLNLDDLVRDTPWISSGRLGRGLAALVMSASPLDWLTGETLNAKKLRALEQDGKLDRHHIFSRDSLNNANVENNLIQSGLNGVLLDRDTNRHLYKYPPEEYIKKALESHDLTDDELKTRIEAYVVPYSQMLGNQNIKQRYKKFLKERANLLEQAIQSKINPG